MTRRQLSVITILCCILVAGCAAKVQEVRREYCRPFVVKGKAYRPLKTVETGFTQDGIASWYGPGFHGKKTASGEVYDMHELTAAHNLLPLKTLVKVKNLENGKETLVRINDRGPFVNDRVIDLSLAAAKGLGIVRPGTARVQLTVMEPGKSLVAAKSKEVPPLATATESPNPFFRDRVRRVLALIR